MADRDIPQPFRSLFGGPALDEPAPPDPPEVEPEEEDDDDDQHIHFVHPVVLLLSNGGMQTTAWKGSLLVGWGWLASFVTVWCVVDAVWWWLARRGFLENVWDLSAGFVWFTVGWVGTQALWAWWKRRLAVKP